MTDEQLKELIDHYKLLKSFLKVDRSLQKQGVWGFIPSDQLGDILKFVRSFESKITMTKQQKIEAAQKRIKELELLIKSWSKK